MSLALLILAVGNVCKLPKIVDLMFKELTIGKHAIIVRRRKASISTASGEITLLVVHPNVDLDLCIGPIEQIRG